jgi:polygalacturonase
MESPGGFQCASTQPDSSKDRIVMYVDVKDYGAVGDGIADDIGPFNTAISAAAGDIVQIPPGTYRINITVTAKLTLAGSG